MGIIKILKDSTKFCFQKIVSICTLIKNTQEYLFPSALPKAGIKLVNRGHFDEGKMVF